MENDNNELDIQNEAVEETETPTTEEDTVDYKALYEEQKREAKKLERKLFTAKASKPLTEKPQVDDETVKTVQRLAMLEEKRQFGFDNGLSPQETDYAFKFSGGKPSKEVLEDPFFKAGLEGLRTQKRVEANIPGSSSRSPIFSSKDFAEMDDNERRSAFESAAKKFKK